MNMTDMELVIKIPEETYRRIQGLVSVDYFEHDICGFSMRRIADGTPLPKGHGRLIDADALNFNADYNEPLISKLDFDQAPTIIEADNGEENEKL